MATSAQMATHGLRSGSLIPGADFSDSPAASPSDIHMMATLALLYLHILASTDGGLTEAGRARLQMNCIFFRSSAN
ncbi:hypothetical protein LTR28_003938 [Elasticomyces elasticus]|nr:hypothetical protein LTR28_003938 [Elasticomyces elasticus]